MSSHGRDCVEQKLLSAILPITVVPLYNVHRCKLYNTVQQAQFDYVPLEWSGGGQRQCYYPARWSTVYVRNLMSLLYDSRTNRRDLECSDCGRSLCVLIDHRFTL